MAMYKKTGAKEYLWLFPFFSGICAVIALLTPTAHFGYGGVTWDWWMWDFISMGVYGYPPITLFSSEMDFIIPSIITTGAIFLSMVSLFILAGKTKKRNLDTKNFTVISVISAVLTIGITIYYMFSVDIAFYDGMRVESEIFPAGYHFWEAFDVSIGIVMAFISAVVSFVGVGVFRYYSNFQRVVAPSKIDTFKEFIPITKDTENLNFCSECGTKMIHADAQFCVNCGFKF